MHVLRIDYSQTRSYDETQFHQTKIGKILETIQFTQRKSKTPNTLSFVLTAGNWGRLDNSFAF